MDSFVSLLARYLRDERGATAIEYGLIAGLASIGIIVWATQIGTTINSFMTTVASNIVGP